MAKILEQKDMNALNKERQKGKDLGLLDYTESNGIDFDESLKSFGFQPEIFKSGDYAVKEFFATTDETVRAILAEAVRDAILMNLGKKSIWKIGTAYEVKINSKDYRVTYASDLLEDVDALGRPSVAMVSVAEGTEIPEAKITFNDKLITTKKKGRAIELTYEYVESMLINILPIYFAKIARKLDLDRDLEYVGVILNGNLADGSDKSPVVTVDTFDYDTITNEIDYMKEVDEYDPTLALMNLKTYQDHIKKIQEFKDSFIFDTAKTGNKPPLYGVTPTISPAIPDDTIILVDPTQLMAHVTYMPFDVETDKIIRKQIHESVASVNDTFGSMFPKAARVIKKTVV